MKKNQLFATVLLFLFGVQLTKADIITPYVMTFDELVSSDVSDWQFETIAPGWKHILQSNEDSYFHQNYSVKVIDGTDKGLYIESDHKMNGWDYEDITDNMLITPAVSGTVTIKYQAKYASSTSNLKIYTYAAGKVGNIAVEITKPENTDWNTLTIATDAANQQFAIHGKEIMLNDFSATSADITMKAGITISAITSPTKDLSVDVDANGFYAFSYVISVKNSGDLDLLSSDLSDKHITVFNSETKAVVATVSLATLLPDGIKKGDKVTGLSVPVKLSITDYPATAQYDLAETINNTTIAGYKITPIPYMPILGVYNGTNPFVNDATFNLGKINQETVFPLTLKNEGAAPMSITSATISGNFALNQTFPINLSAHSEQTVTLTAKVESQGNQTGDLVIMSNGGTYTIHLQSQILDPQKWFVNFEDNQFPADMMNGTLDNAKKGIIAICGLSGNNYWYKSDRSDAEMMTPLLEVNSDDQLTFDFKGRYDYSCVTLSYSTDRVAWTEAAVINKDNQMTQYGGEYSYDNICPITISNIPAGKYYIKFDKINYGFIDNIYGFKKTETTHDWMFSTTTIPATGSVNTNYSANAIIYNMLDKVEDADSYTATLYVDGQGVASATAKQLAAKGNNSYEFTFKPHHTGTFKAYIEFVCGDYKLRSGETDVTIEAESSENMVQIGTKYDTGRAPINVYYSNSESESIYTAAQLAGKLSVGQKISKLIFKGKNSATVTTSLNIWMGTTEDTAPKATADIPVSTEGMTAVYSNDTYTYNKGTDVNVMEVTLSTPYIYTGGNLKIVTATSWKSYASSLYIDVSNITTQSIVRSSDSSLSGLCKAYTQQPVIYLMVESEPATLSGKITNKSDHSAIADVEITLKNGDVEYYGKSDQDGNYSIPVIQTNVEYETTYHLAGYNDVINTTSFANGNVTADVVMSSTATAIDQIISEEKVQKDYIYTIIGQLVRKDGDVNGLPKGIYIRNGKKFVIR